MHSSQAEHRSHAYQRLKSSWFRRRTGQLPPMNERTQELGTGYTLVFSTLSMTRPQWRSGLQGKTRTHFTQPLAFQVPARAPCASLLDRQLPQSQRYTLSLCSTILSEQQLRSATSRGNWRVHGLVRTKAQFHYTCNARKPRRSSQIR